MSVSKFVIVLVIVFILSLISAMFVVEGNRKPKMIKCISESKTYETYRFLVRNGIYDN